MFQDFGEGYIEIDNIKRKNVFVLILNDDFKNKISSGAYNYNNKVIKINSSKLNPVPFTFSLSEDGVVKCKKIITKDSFLEGSINAYGNFKGKLDNVDGVIKDVIIHKTEIDDITLNNSFNCYESNIENKFLTINQERCNYLDNNTRVENFYVNRINIFEQNDYNDYKSYKKEKILINIPVNGIYYITIPKIKFNTITNAPVYNMNGSGSTKVSYKIDNTVIVSGSTTVPFYKDGPYQANFEMGQTTISGETADVKIFTICLEYNFNLAPSDYKTAYFRIMSEITDTTINKIKVQKTPLNNDDVFHINIDPGGLYVNSNEDKKILFDEFGIKLYYKGKTIDLFEALKDKF
jgi:hypothetical protein